MTLIVESRLVRTMPPAGSSNVQQCTWATGALIGDTDNPDTVRFRLHQDGRSLLLTTLPLSMLTDALIRPGRTFEAGPVRLTCMAESVSEQDEPPLNVLMNVVTGLGQEWSVILRRNHISDFTGQMGATDGRKPGEMPTGINWRTRRPVGVR